MLERCVFEIKQVFAPRLAEAADRKGLDLVNNEANAFINDRLAELYQAQDQSESSTESLARQFIAQAEEVQAQYDLQGADVLGYEVRLYLRAANALLTKSGSQRKP
ncbi:hypothetical protein M1615_00490 [Patescibacteria group bacterium]|nr:hypothetical protein [Patescibacteria group bacterium]MCL5010233.1 hypothetical protein [Patescibacteria group bacterium]